MRNRTSLLSFLLFCCVTELFSTLSLGLELAHKELSALYFAFVGTAIGAMFLALDRILTLFDRAEATLGIIHNPTMTMKFKSLYKEEISFLKSLWIKLKEVKKNGKCK